MKKHMSNWIEMTIICCCGALIVVFGFLVSYSGKQHRDCLISNTCIYPENGYRP